MNIAGWALGAGHEEVDGSAGLCWAKERAQCQGEAGASDIDRSRGSRAGGGGVSATHGAGRKGSPYHVAQAPLSPEVEVPSGVGALPSAINPAAWPDIGAGSHALEGFSVSLSEVCRPVNPVIIRNGVL